MSMEDADRYKRKKILLAITTMLSVVLLTSIIAFIYFDVNLYKKILQQQTPQVEELSEHVEQTFRSELNRCVQLLQIDGALVEQSDDRFSEKVMGLLKRTQQISGFRVMGIMDLSGDSMDTTGRQQIDYRPRLKQDIADDKIYVSNVMDSERGEIEILVAVPINVQGAVQGAVWGRYPLKDIVQTVAITDNTARYFQIVDDKGNYISMPQKEHALGQSRTIWEDLDNYRIDNGVTAQDIYEQVQKGESGSFLFDCDGKGHHVNYRPLGINHWYLFAVQTEQSLYQYAEEIQRVSMRFFAVLLMGLVTLASVIVAIVYNMYKVIDQKHSRMQSLNGMFELILQKTKAIPFEVDASKNRVTVYDRQRKFEKQVYALDQIHPEALMEKNHISEESLPEYRKLYDSILHNKECEPAIVYAQTEEKQGWMRITIVAGVGKKQIIGVLEDCDEYMEKEAEIEQYLNNIKKMQKKSQIDFLTGLYNREAIISKVRESLNPKEKKQGIDVFFILDLDQFKKVNDLLGHGMGDAVLKDTAHTLLSCVRKGDSVGRLGGDEFVLFLRNMDKLESVERKAKELNKALNKVYKKDGKSVQVGASIGIAVVSDETATFEALYEKADKALYAVKEKSRNGYLICTE